MTARRVPWRRLTCWEARRVLQTYLDGELDTSSARRVVAHLAQCHRCAGRATVYLAIKESLARRGRTPPGSPSDAVLRLREFAEGLLDESDE